MYVLKSLLYNRNLAAYYLEHCRFNIEFRQTRFRSFLPVSKPTDVPSRRWPQEHHNIGRSVRCQEENQNRMNEPIRRRGRKSRTSWICLECLGSAIIAVDERPANHGTRRALFQGPLPRLYFEFSSSRCSRRPRCRVRVLVHFQRMEDVELYRQYTRVFGEPRRDCALSGNGLDIITPTWSHTAYNISVGQGLKRNGDQYQMRILVLERKSQTKRPHVEQLDAAPLCVGEPVAR